MILLLKLRGCRVKTKRGTIIWQTLFAMAAYVVLSRQPCNYLIATVYDTQCFGTAD